VSDGAGRVLVVDDNPDLLHVLRTSLEQEGHDVRVAEDGRAALDMVDEWQPDVIILDIMLPDLSGWEACDRLRQTCQAPIIFLTARDSEADVVRGLNHGADDFVTKPFSLAELKARVETMLRRAHGAEAPPPGEYRDDVLHIDLLRGMVYHRGQRVLLRPKEYQLLAVLVENEGKVLGHDRLLREVWGHGYEEERAYLQIYIRYLREKLEDDPGNPRYIHTHHGVGYSFAPLRSQASEPDSPGGC